MEFVRIICDCTFTPKDARDPISIKVGEEYRLINKMNADWWFVQKEDDSKTQFSIPAKYVEILKKDQLDGVGMSESNTLSKTKNPAPRPKPRTSKTSSSDETTPRVLTAAEDEAKQLLTSGKTVPQTTKPLYENVEMAKHPVKISQTDNIMTTTQKPLPGHETKSPTSKISSENQATTQLSSIVEADVLQAKKLAEKQTYQEAVKQADIKIDKDTGRDADIKTVKQNDSKTDTKSAEQATKSHHTLESLDVAEIAVTSQREAERLAEKHSPVVARNIEVRTEASSSSVPSSSVTQEDEINYVNLDDYRLMVKDHIVTPIISKDNRAESETSDYRSGDSKGGSRESLESKSCDTDSIGTKEDLDKSDSAVRVDFAPKMELPAKPVQSKVGAVSKASSNYENVEDFKKSIQDHQPKSQNVGDGNSDTSPQVNVPPGWTTEEENGETAFVNTADGEKWKIACDSSGRKYFYNSSTNQTVWNLAEVSKSGKGNHNTDPPDAGLVETDFLPLEPLPLKMVQKQGQLNKAKVDDQGKKSKKLSWSQSFVVLVENVVYFYKDLKVATGSKVKSIASLGKPELTLQLDNATVSSSPDDKKKEILILSLSNGMVYLLHNESEEALLHWRQSLENNIDAIKTVSVTDSKEVENLPVRPDAVFGSSLTIICEREKTNIPRFVHACLAAVEKRGLDVDGIYRVSGNMSLVQKLRQMTDQNEFYDVLSPSWDVHTITGALKLFFRELSEPIFTFALFDEFLNAFRITDRIQKIQAYREVIKKLPPFHAETMKKLFKHLAEVICHGASNRMQPQALAIVFGPTLLWPESKNKDIPLPALMVCQGQVVEFMIIEFRFLFS